MHYKTQPNTSKDRAHCRHYWIFYVCGYLSLYLHGQACSHHSCLPGIQHLQVWAWMQTLSPLMQLLLLQSLLFFSHLPVTFPTVLCHSCQGPCHILVTWGRLVSLTPSGLISTIKFILITPISLSWICFLMFIPLREHHRLLCSYVPFLKRMPIFFHMLSSFWW